MQESQKQYQKLGFERNPNFCKFESVAGRLSFAPFIATARLIPTNLSMPFHPLFFCFLNDFLFVARMVIKHRKM
jgi:hypothetical protein